jgi:hypothetical protein
MKKHKDPFDRPVDRILLRVRMLCREYEIDDPHRLLPGEGDEPDGWLACCPLHPSAGQTLLVIDRGDDREPYLSCSVGCPSGSVRYALDLDPELNEAAEAASQVLAWAQRFTRERRRRLDLERAA